MKRIASVVTGGATALVWAELIPRAAAQCAMCRTGLLNSPEGQQLVAGFNSGILFLLAVPIVIFASVLFLLWRAARKRSRAAKEAGIDSWELGPDNGMAPLPNDKLAAPEELGEPA